MTRPIRVLAIGCLLLFFALMLRATYVQWWESDALSSVSKAVESALRLCGESSVRRATPPEKSRWIIRLV